MVTKVRTIDFLPEIFRTKTNSQFLAATLDQLVQQPDFKRIQGYAGSKFGYGVSASDKYLVEPSDVRTNYQLDPAVVFKKNDTSVAVDLITYPGLLDSLKLQGGSVKNNDSLFRNQFYSWDSFADLDKVINYSQYYWLPTGPEPVSLTSTTLYKSLIYDIVEEPLGYRFNTDIVEIGQLNPVITLVRGGVYQFAVDQPSKFYIQTQLGTSGVDPARPNFSTREVEGVDNNGTNNGTVTFQVPLADAQDGYIYPGNLDVDLVTTLAFSDINGKRVSDLPKIDGVSIVGKTLLFYGTKPGAMGLVSKEFYGDVFDDEPYEDSTPSEINKHFYTVNVSGDNSKDYVIELAEAGLITDNTKITVRYGNYYIGRNFVKNSYGEIILIPMLTASLDTLYYQDGVNSEIYGTIKLVDAPTNVVIDIADIIGKKNYTSPNGVKLTNGLKVQFTSTVFPESYNQGQYYVEGVGTSIELLPVDIFEIPEPFGTAYTTPFDRDPYDAYSYGETLYYPAEPDYITIARNSIDRNAWSRSNRWFHIDVLNTTIANTSASPISSNALGNPESRAKRPVIEFYPNLKLFNSGSIAKPNTSFVNFTITDAFSQVAGQPVSGFNPDGATSYLYDGATIIFANDADINVRTKIWEVALTSVTGVSEPIVTLTVAVDGDISYSDQTVITQGETYQGYTVYYNGSEWLVGQQKDRVNQPPTFDVFDNSGVSYSDKDFYPSNTFDGCTLLEYATGTGSDDPILGFPIKYSSLNNLGDITFNVTLNTQSFEYVLNSETIQQLVSAGYVYNFKSRTDYTRMIGWQTAPAESFQYQVFDTVYNGYEFTLDVAAKSQSTTPWPVVVVYVDNARVANTDYTMTVGTNTTVIELNTLPATGTLVNIMIYSDQPSSIGYYQIPTNLDHNPFNSEISTINLGDIRGHYKSICNNAPDFVGLAFGSNNYRDLGNVVPYGTRIVQNSASVVNAAAFLRNNDNNFFDALTYNNNEYSKFKASLIYVLTNNEYTSLDAPSYILDDVLEKIAETKIDTNPFFWSDMLPSKNAYITNTYTFKTQLDSSSFNLNRVYSFTEANYYGVLVYLTRRIDSNFETTQLVRGVDYVVSDTNPSLLVTKDLINNDVITIKEYDQTYGSFVPNTPTKLGLYPSFLPEVILDETYITPSHFIRGHDGSFTKLYGTYQDGVLSDYRDKVLLEFETRIFNNLKISSVIPVSYDEVVPGQFRDIGIDFETFNILYSLQYLNWIGANRIDYETQYYSSTNPYTYNYRQSTFSFDNKLINQGNWRGIYLWLYDTSNPDTMPWEILGLASKPTWWDTRYGAAPYTGDNLFMWQDIANGYIWNDGAPYINKQRIRDGLLDIIPVDSSGNLRAPFDFLLGSYEQTTFKTNWVVGDMGPAEYSYRKSSAWPFDLMRIAALTKPAKFFSLGKDVDRYKYNAEFNRYLFDGRYSDTITSLAVYGSGTPVHSYVNWLVDYLYQFGVNGTETISSLVKNLDVRLTYRLAGFSDKDLLNFYVEKGSANSANNSLLIPDDSYSIMLYNNEPGDTIIYSSVIVLKTETGYKVYGNSQNKTYFTTRVSVTDGLYDSIIIDGFTAKVPKTYYDRTQVIPYGQEYRTLDALGDFLRGYGLYLSSQGLLFNDVENGLELNWDQMTAEAIHWALTGWEAGSSINLNPCARNIAIDKENNIVQPLTMFRENFVLNQNLIPIALNDLFINRDSTAFSIKSLNEGDSLCLLKANLSTIEHVVVFDNTTVFNDIIYNLVTGLRQQRILVKGKKTAEWNGQVNAAGFILNQDNIQNWQENIKYTKGTIVKYKNDYYMADAIVILPSSTFDYNQWTKTSYNDIQKGLLPNPSTRAYEATLFYNMNNPNLENDEDLLGFSLIGYRPRNYLVDANLSDSTQVNLYKDMISAKGTVASVTKLQGINLQQNTLNYDVHENWAIKTTEYGGLLNQNFAEFTLNETFLTGNPSTIAIVKGNSVNGAQQQIQLSNAVNYGRPLTSSDIMPSLDSSYIEKLPSAGYVNMDDVVEIGYKLDDLSDAAITSVYKNEYIWVADKDNTWQVYTPVSTGAIVTSVVNNLNSTITVTFDKPHNLLENQAMGILNFDPRIDGYYVVYFVSDLTSVIVPLALDSTVTSISGTGLSYLLQSQRVATSRDISSLPLLNSEYANNRVWVDQNVKGSWTVYEKTNNYEYNYLNPIIAKEQFGSAVAYAPNIGYFVSDLGTGTLYHYAIAANGTFYERSSITEGGEFGTCITRSQDLLIVSKPGNSLSQIMIYRLPPVGNINSIVLEQTITLVGGRAGEAMDISGDSNILYIGAKTEDAVIAFQRDKTLTYTSSGLTLLETTVVKEFSFVVDGDARSIIDDGQRISFVTSYAPLGFTAKYAVPRGQDYFKVSGDQRSLLTHGDKVAFANTGPVSTRLVTIAAESYDSGLNETTFYTVEMFFAPSEPAVAVGASVYKVTFSDNAVHTVITGIYDEGNDITVFYTIEPIEYTAASGSYIYFATVNFSLSGFVETALVQTGDEYGASIATNYDGSKVFIGAPKTNYSETQENTGTVYFFDRIRQNVEVQYDQNPYNPYVVVLTFTPNNQTRLSVNGVLLATSKYVVISNLILIGTIGMKAGDIVTVDSVQFVLTQQLYPIDTLADLRPGENFGASLDCNTYGSEVAVGSPYDVTNDSQKEGSVYRFTNGGKRFGTMIGTVAANLTEATYILLNGYIVNLFQDSPILTTVTTGSTTVSIDPYVAAKLPSTGIITFKDVTTSVSRSIAYSSVNAVTGVITFATSYPFSTTYTDPDGYLRMPLGNATNIASAINLANITNIFSYPTEDGRLIIRLRDNDLGQANNKLNLSVFNGNYLYMMGLYDYVKSQVIQDPHPQTKTLFGSCVKFNDENSLVISAPANTRFIDTKFDFSNDNNIHNDTVFDNNFTMFQDASTNAGSVYMYDYIASYDESLTNISKYVYAQSCNDTILDYGFEPLYGTSLAFNDGVVVIGSPSFKDTGRVIVYINGTQQTNWHVARESASIVDVQKIQKVALYNNIDNQTLAGLDYIDPLQGKLLGVVGENLDFTSDADPAGYNGPGLNRGTHVWLKDQIGKLWYNTSTTRFLNYHQDDIVYNGQYWGRVFPGSDVTVYSWVQSDVLPISYAGTGTPYDTEKYSVILETDSNNNLVPKYYYWVRNTNTVYTLLGKTLSDTIIERYIADPVNSGVAFIAPLQTNAFGLYNTQEYINDVSTNIHLGFSSGTSDSSGHLEFELIRSNYPDDFISGFPDRSKGYDEPTGLYDRLLDSFAGVDETGAIVPDPYLPKLLQLGVSVRPRQGFFIDRLVALQNYLEYANSIMLNYPINELGNTTFLFAQGDDYDTTLYWENIYWWEAGYNNSTRASLEVPIYSDLLTLSPRDGQIVGVAANSNGKREVYIYQNSEWVRIGVQDGTIRFLNTLWDYNINKIGFGDTFFGEGPYDSYPSTETRYIIRALNEQIYVDTLFKHRNKSLTLIFEFIQSENIESQNYIPWLSKTSFADVSYSVRELTTNQKFQRDNQSLLEGYINEVKPYHVMIKEFYLGYARTDVYEGDVTDFDLPAVYDANVGKFITPQLINAAFPSDVSEFSASDAIWSTTNYNSWYTNYGALINSQPETVVCRVSTFMTVIDQEIYVDNAEGMPVTGIILIEDEVIGYTGVDREHRKLTGISRGVNNTTATTHVAGTPITMDLPGIVVLYSARAYDDIPTVSAYIDTNIYPAPKTPAKLAAIMTGDKVVGVEVIDSGEGYVVTPEIVFEPSFTYSSEFYRINFFENTIQITGTNIDTGEIFYSQGISSNGISIVPDGYYYVNATGVSNRMLLSVSGVGAIVSLHKTYRDSILGINKVEFLPESIIVEDYVHELSMRPRAIPSMDSSKVRSIKPVLRFDRTSYKASVKPWTPGEYYSSPYVSTGNDSSDSTKLYVGQPYTNLSGTVDPSGGTGAVFTVYNVYMGGNYEVTITDAGADYSAADEITIDGSDLGGTTIVNNCVITVDTVDGDGAILTYTVTGTPVDAQLASLQGAVLPITELDSLNGGAVVTVTYTLGLQPGQANGANMYFYRTHDAYTYPASPITGSATIKIFRPKFNPFNISNLYYMQIIDEGTIYEAGQRIVIPGGSLGGTTGVNDAIITIEAITPIVGQVGSILSASISGIAVGEFAQYYVRPVSDTQLAVFVDAAMQIPVPYSSFIWSGASNRDYGYLPEPIVANYSFTYDTTSIVSYDGYIWKCIDSNSDNEFDPTKWSVLGSDDGSLNALDRIEGYYQPTVGMPGKDAQQLVKGITYPNNVYYGNAFAPEDELPLDYIVRDRSFYPTSINVKAIVYGEGKLVAACDALDHSVVLVQNETGTWNSYKLSNTPVDITDIAYHDGTYIITTNSPITPIYVSYDGQVWVTSGEYTPYDILDYGDGGFDSTDVNAPDVSLDSVTVVNGVYYSVGEVILRSTDSVLWQQVYTFGSNLENILYDITYIDSSLFGGYVAVGSGYIVTSGSNTPTPTVTYVGRILTSVDGQNWVIKPTVITGSGFRAITASSTTVVIVGENSVVKYSSNTSNWVNGTITPIGITPVPTVTINSIATNGTIFVAVGDKTGSGDTDPGFIITSVDGITWTQRSSQYITTENLNSVYYYYDAINDPIGHFYAVGENNTIIRSSNGVNWTDISEIEVDEANYVVQGNDFLYGYGPEELVAGVVSDNLSMYVHTAPGAYWDIERLVGYWYKNTGFNMQSIIVDPDLELTVSFKNVVVNPARVSVFVIEDATQLSYRIYQDTATVNNPTSYSVNWYSQTITLNQALAAGNSLLIEVYEVGNGKELIRSNSSLTPMRINANTGNTEFVFEIQYQSLVNDPLVYVNGEKKLYGTDYIVTYTDTNFMKLLFLNDTYDNSTDYIVFSIVGDSSAAYNTVQYGYSIPETQIFTTDTVINDVPLDMNLISVEGDNIVNAIVELNGIRLIPYPIDGYDYQINSSTNELEMRYLPVYPDDVLSITTYYDTSRQYLTTEAFHDNTGNGLKVYSISYVDKTVTPVVITLAQDPGYTDGDLVRVDNVQGSTELNNNTFYVKSTTYSSGSDYYYELYTDSGLTDPVMGIDISNYDSGGFVWLDADTIVIPNPTIPDPPPAPNPMPVMTYTDGSRTWVTIDGKRLNPELLTFNEDNKLSVLTELDGSERIIVTSMVTGASPNSMSFNVSVNKAGLGSVYRTNPEDSTWLTQDLATADDIIYFYDVSNLISNITSVADVELSGETMYAYVQFDINTVKGVSVYNNTTLTLLDSTMFGTRLLNGKSVLEFSSGVSEGDTITVTLTIGNIVEINGERIRFDSIDIVANTVSGLTRGIQGTHESTVHRTYDTGYGINAAKKITDEEYRSTWNSTNITSVGDPLQISTTTTARFLQSNRINER